MKHICGALRWNFRSKSIFHKLVRFLTILIRNLTRCKNYAQTSDFKKFFCFRNVFFENAEKLKFSSILRDKFNQNLTLRMVIFIQNLTSKQSLTHCKVFFQYDLFENIHLFWNLTRCRKNSVKIWHVVKFFFWNLTRLEIFCFGITFLANIFFLWEHSLL